MHATIRARIKSVASPMTPAFNGHLLVFVTERSFEGGKPVLRNWQINAHESYRPRAEQLAKGGFEETFVLKTVLWVLPADATSAEEIHAEGQAGIMP